MLPLILTVPSSLLVTPDAHQGIDPPGSQSPTEGNPPSGLSHRFVQKQQTQQLEEKLNATQKHYELEKKQLQILPPSRLDCVPFFPPVSGRDPISCSMP